MNSLSSICARAFSFNSRIITGGLFNGSRRTDLNQSFPDSRIPGGNGAAFAQTFPISTSVK
jgi:hypothetical protein